METGEGKSERDQQNVALHAKNGKSWEFSEAEQPNRRFGKERTTRRSFYFIRSGECCAALKISSIKMSLLISSFLWKRSSATSPEVSLGQGLLFLCVRAGLQSGAEPLKGPVKKHHTPVGLRVCCSSERNHRLKNKLTITCIKLPLSF